MPKQLPTYLKLVNESSNEILLAEAEDRAGLAELCQAFEQATGWGLDYTNDTNQERPAPSEAENLMWSAPVLPGVGASPGLFRIFSQAPEREPAVSLEMATRLAAGVAEMWNELSATRHALWQREAELAINVPAISRDDDAQRLAERLEAVLKSGAQAVGCQAAALYLLDPATTELKLRAAWGLPRKRLVEPARPLKSAMADLEALLGHAVVLSDNLLNDYWRAPENFGSAVCVPVSTAATPLGTLWIFGAEARDYSDAQTGMIEVVAGRLAAELEREALFDEALAGRRELRRLTPTDASEFQAPPSPSITGWDVAARAPSAGMIGGSFYDWRETSAGFEVVASVANLAGVSGSLTAAALRATFRSLGAGSTDLLAIANNVLWSGSAGDQQASLVQLTLAPNGRLTWNAAGALRGLLISGATSKQIFASSQSLGDQETLLAAQGELWLSPGETLLVYGLATPAGAELSFASIDDALVDETQDRPASRGDLLVDACDRRLQAVLPGAAETDRLILAIKRRS